MTQYPIRARGATELVERVEAAVVSGALLPDLGAARRRRAAPARLYGAPSVLPELAARARAQLRADAVPADAVCVVNGAHDGIERVLHAHLRPGDRVAVENPGYAALFDL